MKRLIAALLMVAAAALTAGLGPAFAGSDAPLDTTTCEVTGTVSFSPPITNTIQTTVTDVYDQVTLTNCSGSVRSAHIKGSLTGTGSCKKGSAAGTLTFRWNTKTRSKVRIKFKSGTLTGTVKTGTFSVAAVTGAVVLSPVGNCATGVTSAGVKGTITL